jgi:hypothetical protein
MARMPRPSTGKLGVGDVLGHTFGIFFRYFIPVVLAAAVLQAIVLLLEFQSIQQFKDARDPVTAWSEAPESFISQFSGTVVGYFLQGMLTFIVLQHMRGQKPGPFAALGTGVTRTLRALPVALSAALVVGGLMFMGGFIGPLATIPAAIIACGWFVAVPAAAVEGLGVGEALGRSWALTTGSKWRIFGVQIVLTILALVALFAIVFRTISYETSTFEDLRSIILVTNAIMLPLACLLGIAAPVAYCLLRRDIEGADVEELAAVFD